MPRKPIPAPTSLGDVGREKWQQLAPRLTETSAITLDQLLIYCRAFECWVLAQEDINKPLEVLTLKTDRGTVTRTIVSPRTVAEAMEKTMRDAAPFLEGRMQT